MDDPEARSGSEAALQSVATARDFLLGIGREGGQSFQCSRNIISGRSSSVIGEWDNLKKCAHIRETFVCVQTCRSSL